MKYRVPGHVAWLCGDDIGAGPGVFVIDVRKGQPLVLQGTAEVIWLVAAEGGDLPADVMVPETADPAAVHEQVSGFADQLVAIGVLEEEQ